MSEPVSSLLTRTQRDRVRSGFDGVESAKRRRDERKVRARVAAGLDDFELLVDYPDRQFELAFADRSEADLRARLADAHLTLERIRALHDVDRDAVIECARERRQALSDDAADSLSDVQLRTRDEWRRELEASVADEYRPSRWKRRSDAFLKVGLALLAVTSLLAVVAPEFTNGPGSVLGIVGAVVLAAGLAIVGIRAVKYDLLPALRLLASDPRQAVRGVWNQF